MQSALLEFMRNPLPVSKWLPGNWIRTSWDALHPLPYGPAVFSRLLGMVVPYTGSMGARVLRLEPGFAVVELRDRHAVRNHLQSIHAIALANLAELTGNLALAGALSPDQRFIVRSFSIEYLHKARGIVRAVCECPIPGDSLNQDFNIHVKIENQEGTCVATATMCTRVGSKKRKE